MEQNLIRLAPAFALQSGQVPWMELGTGIRTPNIDIADLGSDDRLLRVLAIYTMIEMHGGEDGLPAANTESALVTLHGRSLRLFGETLSEEGRQMIGLDMDRYQ